VPLAPGTRLGPYEILSLLGAGGMGEVYRARDTRLDRIVAIKILAAADAELEARFQREAKAIAALAHPHICRLYDVGREDGTDYLVLEYLEGETLAQRLRRGPIKIDEALTFATEIAEALTTAHRSGIVHRDLKPANVMLTKGGVKLLDFGLAKLRPHAAVMGARNIAVTATAPPNTERGSILGTLPYMAPEQLEGQEADERTDIFAFGAVVYEMITGRKTFDGPSQASLIAAILEHQPPPMSTAQPLAPPAVDHIVRRCLAKNRDERWQTAADLTQELRWAKENAGDAAAMESIRPSRPRVMWFIASGVITALVGLAVWRSLNTSTSQSAPPLSVSRSLIDIAPAERLPVLPNGAVLALAPDGKTLVFVGVRDGIARLYSRALNKLEAVPIPGTDVNTTEGAGIESLFFSPDGRWIGFWVGTNSGGALKKIALEGGPVTTLCATPSLYGVSWTDQGTIVFANNGIGGLWRVSDSGGQPQALTTVNLAGGEASHRFPQMLPGAKTVMFTVQRASRTWDDAQIVARSLATGEQRVLVQGAADARYVAGHLVYAQRGSLVALPFDPVRLEARGDPVTIVGEVMQAIDENLATGGTGAAQYGVADSGAVTYLTGGVRHATDRSLVWVSRAGVPTALPAPRKPYFWPRLSPDGTRIAVFTGAGDQQIWIYDITRGSMTRLTTSESRPYEPVWTTDGTRVVFGVGGLGPLFWKRWDENGPAVPFTSERDGAFLPRSWSPDGHLAVTKVDKGEIWILSSGGQPVAKAFIKAPSSSPTFSPDGRWIAYVSNESGVSEVYAVPFPGPGGRQPISVNGGNYPVWSRDSHELSYVQAIPQTGLLRMMAVDVTTDPTFTVGKPRALFEGAYQSSGYDVAADGRFLMVALDTPASAASSPQMVLVLNWQEELKPHAPTK
jgi:serine/threonine-protein kinase